MINKYYALDLAPGRSMIEHFVAQGLQVFVISWRNPTSEHRDWGFDAYATAILAALDVVSDVSASPRTHLAGACSGGVVAAMLASHLAQQGSADRLASLTLLVTVLDSVRAGLPRAVASEGRARAIKAASARRGYLDGHALAEVFAWLRPGDLIWNYWVNNYLMGNDPPAFDILAWNADVTRMPAQLHHDFVDQGLGNTIAESTQPLLGGTVDIGAIELDTYLVAGVADHLTDWESCYRTRELLGGPSRFVLSSSGHVAALVNPPGNPKAEFRVGDDRSVPAAEFVAASQTMPGTWWDDIAAWLKQRGGGSRPAPGAPGSAEHPVLGPAPGGYVHQE
jgi:polyhydroxyalkanoate synthase